MASNANTKIGPPITQAALQAATIGHHFLAPVRSLMRHQLPICSAQRT